MATASVATVLLVSRLVSRLVGIVGGSAPSACRDGDAVNRRKREYRQFKGLVASCQTTLGGKGTKTRSDKDARNTCELASPPHLNAAWNKAVADAERGLAQ